MNKAFRKRQIPVLNAFGPILSVFLPKVRELQDKVNEGDKDDEPGKRSAPLPPPPPPPPPATTVTKYAPHHKKTPPSRTFKQICI